MPEKRKRGWPAGNVWQRLATFADVIHHQCRQGSANAVVKSVSPGQMQSLSLSPGQMQSPLYRVQSAGAVYPFNLQVS